MPQPNPFAGKIPGRPEVQSVDAESRLRMVREFTLLECNQALHLPGLQKTVALALVRRVRALSTTKGAQ
jgi:hypothetical protein